MELAEQGKLEAILCKTDKTPDYLIPMCGEISKVWRVQWDIDEGYICPIGEHGFWVSLDDLIIIEN